MGKAGSSCLYLIVAVLAFCVIFAWALRTDLEDVGGVAPVSTR